MVNPIISTLKVKYPFNLNPFKDVRFVTRWFDMCGWWHNVPVILLEGYEHNTGYTLELMANIGNLFDNIGFVSEGEMFND